jgi:hypothetical protein
VQFQSSKSQVDLSKIYFPDVEVEEEEEEEEDDDDVGEEEDAEDVLDASQVGNLPSETA